MAQKAVEKQQRKMRKQMGYVIIRPAAVALGWCADGQHFREVLMVSISGSVTIEAVVT
jgi:hypothetical protein